MNSFLNNGIAFLVGMFANFAQMAAFRLFIGTFYGTELHLGAFLAVWLGGIALGGALAGLMALPVPWLLGLLFIGPFLTTGALWGMVGWFPAMNGGFLPFLPVLLFMVASIFPVAVPIGALLPAMMRHTKGSLNHVFAAESFGSFLGGILFSLVFKGLIPSVYLLSVLPVLPLTALLLTIRRYRGWVGMSLIAFVPFSWWAAPQLETLMQNRLWTLFHPGFEKVCSVESPYQHIQVGNYQGQFNLYLDGTFACSWPDPTRAEERVHTFVTAIADPRKILVLGAPTTDVIDEFKKYPGLITTIIELDGHIGSVLRGNASDSKKIQWVIGDPRAFLRNSTEAYDGIMVLSSDPTTLLSNRLFTLEAFTEMKNRLAPNGVMTVSVAGAENYLGSQMEQVLLSMRRTLDAVFPEVFAIPGDPVMFWAAAQKGVLVTDPTLLGERFQARSIPTVSFQPMTFSNVLLPFRVNELVDWFKRPVVVKLNEDANPRAFMRQIQLWDIFSGSRMGPWLSRLEAFDLQKSVVGWGVLVLAGLGLLFCMNSARREISVFSLSAGITGAVGLLLELILILSYQNRHGAMFQMAALFFGLYMLGLSLGSLLESWVSIPGLRMIRRVKVLQIAVAAMVWGMIGVGEWHSLPLIGAMIFLVAFLAGFEFVMLDKLLRHQNVSSAGSSSLLFWTDNGGALFAAFAAGVWFLPVMGMNGTTLLAACLLSGNLLWLMSIKQLS